VDETLEAVKDLLVARKFAEAVERARRVVAAQPRNAQGWVFLAEGLENLGRRHEAWLAYERAWILDPRATWAAPARNRLFPLVPGRVADWLQEALTVPSVSVTAAFIVRDAADTLEEAIARVRDAVDEVLVADTGSADDSIAVAERAGARVIRVEWTDDFAAARNAALEAVQTDWVLWVDADEWLDPEDRAVPKTVAGLFAADAEPPVVRVLHINHVAEGTAWTTERARLHATGRGLRWWGRVHERLGRSRAAWFEEEIEGPTVRIRLHHEGSRPEIQRLKGVAERNARLLRRAVEEDPDDVRAWLLLGAECHRMGRLDDAIDALNQAEAVADRHPEFRRLPEVRALLVDALLSRQRVEEALAVSERAVEAAPDFPAAWYYRGKAELAVGLAALGRARKDFLRAQEAVPGYRGPAAYDPQIPFWKIAAGLADVSKLLGNWVEARSLYERILVASPQNEAVRQQLEQMDRQIAALAHRPAAPSETRRPHASSEKPAP
jgi:tetratricopeptide (TPR) repeat protein